MFSLRCQVWLIKKLSDCFNVFYLFVCYLIKLAHVAQNATEQGLVLDNLSAGYQKKIIVDDISLTIPPEKMTVLVGANGCGK